MNSAKSLHTYINKGWQLRYENQTLHKAHLYQGWRQGRARGAIASFERGAKIWFSGNYYCQESPKKLFSNKVLQLFCTVHKDPERLLTTKWEPALTMD